MNSKQYEELKNAVSEINKKLTMYEGVKLDEPQDGNVGTSNAEGEVEFSKFENAAKKKKLLSSMLGE